MYSDILFERLFTIVYRRFVCAFVRLLPPANEVCEGYVFTGVCLSTLGGTYVVLFRGACVVLFGGHVWFYLGGCAWFHLGGHAWFYLGWCAWFYSGGHVWFFLGGVHGFFSFFGYNEIRSMSGRYASYWNAFLFMKITIHFQKKSFAWFCCKVQTVLSGWMGIPWHSLTNMISFHKKFFNILSIFFYRFNVD